MNSNPERNSAIDFEEKNKEAIVQFKQALRVVLTDAPTEPVDAIFLHSMSFGDDEEMFPLAAKLITDGKAQYVAINGSDGETLGGSKPGEAWAGKDDYIRRLTECGVSGDRIILTPPAFHTRQNNGAFLETSRQKNWKTAVTLNQPQQLLRATLGQIRVMDKENYWMRLYSIYPEPWDAARPVYGSQGAEKKRRFTFLPADFERILAYQAKGDLATFDEYFNYLKKRPEIR